MGSIRSSDRENQAAVEEQFSQASRIDPNNALTWVMRSRFHMFNGNGETALHFAKCALELSPLDPFKYFFEIIMASALSTCEDYSGALRFAERSLHANPNRTSSHRVRVIALELMGREHEARDAAKVLTRFEPDLTIANYLKGHPAGDGPITRKWAGALKSAGVPQK